MIKRALVLLTILSTILLFACGDKNENIELDDSKIKIVTTIYPEYDWIKNIIKGKEDLFSIKMLMTSGIDLHNFQPSAKDILDVGKADLFVYVGGESDKWVEGVLNQAVNKKLKAINLMEMLKGSIKVEEFKEGMQEEEEEGEESEEVEYDEHVWLSLRNAANITTELSKEIIQLDPSNKEVYEANTREYLINLKNLDFEFGEAVADADRWVVIFGDRFPFRYLFDDYSIDYYAAFKGCSAETEASFKTIKYLADKLSEENLPYVLKIEKSNDKIAKAIIDNSTNKKTKIETMYSIQAVTDKEIKQGNSYISYMQKNLEVLKKVLK